jgi:tetratricopeptide (TPR) repeat protein
VGAGLAWVIGLGLLALSAMQTPAASGRTNAVLVELEGQVMVTPAGATTWNPGRTNQVLFARDRVRTMARSRAVIRLTDLSTWRVGPDTILEIPAEREGGGGFQLFQGLLYYFHRDKPGVLPVRTRAAYATILGTEFTIAVAEDGTTRIDLIDGRVDLTNEAGVLHLSSGQAATVSPGRPPAPSPALATVNVVQWVLHYPAVLDLDELRLDPAGTETLTNALAAYRSGDLSGAIALLPEPPAAGRTIDERLFRAGLQLSVGSVAEAEASLGEILVTPTPAADDRPRMLARSLQTLIAAIRYSPGAGGGPSNVTVTVSPLGPPEAATFPRGSATALLAESYFQQSRGNLERARTLARGATVIAPNNGFAWARVAELEFSLGERASARGALERALRASPRHAAARALEGFVLAAENRVVPARQSFDEALALDGALGDAWLGRGLCRIRLGDLDGGRDDLQIAATVEPQRALFRSYLGKAYGQSGDLTRASHELNLARGLDPNDPTAWFYSALLLRDQNRINAGVRDMVQAGELNGNRQIYRGELMLDQDAAVQGVNLAGLLGDAGLREWSTREAGRAVQLDPANAAAHLFLGDSYQQERDFNRINQRFETPAITEYLLANLLSPIGAGTLAQSVTHQEYSRLFEADGPGFFSATEYLSRGAWTESAAHYGTLRNSSFALSGFYRSDSGQSPNNDSEQHEISFQFKQQLTPADSVYVQVIQGEFSGGDLRARQDPAQADRSLRVSEEQEPLLLVGYHHEWGPGSHTLALGGWLNDRQRVTDDDQQTLLMNKFPTRTNVTYAVPALVDQRYQASAGIFTAELQQLWQRGRHGAIVGARFQDGTIEAREEGANSRVPDVPLLSGFPTPPQRIEEDLNRVSGYGYYQVQPWPAFLLVGGLSYDWLRSPANFRYAPIRDGERELDQLSPKGGFIWTPWARGAVRAGYSQSLGGAAFDQSFRLEPSQVAGFNQAFRSIIPESVAGANAGARFESWNAAFEQRFGRGTFVTLGAERLQSGLERVIGVYDYGQPLPAPAVVASSTRERLDFDEHTVILSANQLVGEEWSFGARYRASHAELRTHFPAIPNVVPTGTVPARTESEGMLHQVSLSAGYHHPSGFFGLADVLWNGQANQGAVAQADDDFWQVHLQAGWRGWRRRLEVRVGVLNVFDQDYRLSPLNLTQELPRERTFVAACRLHF